ncbi:MAG: ABC transporter permease [Methyloversatilis sp.]|jgi:sulfonate transport system permease protein|uniref:Aliphatic sulfonates transport permease protein ssuC n=1 Tax=Methyloversatilis universalis (strain ATCC BAA-1314 / DSM 25237 / JCM 13912 / CCUG 52030 / FAM5) TaxID=1000565 RepID=F5RA21_METUF|nr:ABC transporter permease [Methyloversatilis universalis]EGK72624.1 Putative aliphatic sulfonates transport permease protein ssuC [Methyloversatilis universalis FAM5]MCP4635193.1 ABC transporter permease [Methyloversatilis sp.]
MNTAARTSSLQATVSSARPAVPAGRAGRPHPALGWVLPVLTLLAFEALVRSGLLAAHLFPAPSEIVRTLFDLGSGLASHIGVSLARVAGGFAIGASLAVIAAVVVGLDRRAEALLDPTFQALRAVPSLAWVPLLLLWLGIDETPKITLIAIGAFFPVYLNLLSGLRNVDRKLVELGEVYGLSRTALVRRILLPASLPSLYTGLRVGLSLAWMFLVAAELIAATRGLGYLLTDGRETSRPDIVLAAILLLAVLGKLSDSVLKSLEKRALVWRDALETRLG